MTQVAEASYAMITLDSCRYDVAAEQQLPHLSALGPLRRARTMGCFTLPAHAAFFGGFLPNVMERPRWPRYSREKGPLFRLDRARRHPRRSDNLGALYLPGDSVPAGFQAAGYRTVGAGGVRWFASAQLRTGFDEFHYWEPQDDTNDRFAVRDLTEFPLTNLDRLTDALAGDSAYFLFVNCPETHAPYLCGDETNEQRESILAACRRLEPIWNGKDGRLDEVDPDPADFDLLKQAQARALSVVDARLGELFAQLPRPVRVVVCADHGEAFGENRRWGHDFPDDAVMDVPIWYGDLE